MFEGMIVPTIIIMCVLHYWLRSRTFMIRPPTGAFTMRVGNRTFAFPQWAFQEILNCMTPSERSIISDATYFHSQREHALSKLAAAKKGWGKKNIEKYEEALLTAEQAFQKAASAAQPIYEAACDRWLRSARGQKWLSTQNLMYP